MTTAIEMAASPREKPGPERPAMERDRVYAAAAAAQVFVTDIFAVAAKCHVKPRAQRARQSRPNQPVSPRMLAQRAS
jgi:hypothetical protein